MAPVGVLDTALCFVCEQLHFSLCLVLLPWNKSHWPKLCPLPLSKLQRLFPFLVSTQETILMVQANTQKYIFFEQASGKWIAHSDSFGDTGSWPCSENPLWHCCFGYLLMFNHSPPFLSLTHSVLLPTLQSGDGRLCVWQWVSCFFSEAVRMSSGSGAKINADYSF